MCGRYRLSRRKQLLEEYFGADFKEQDWAPRYNIVPTQSVPVIRQQSLRKLSLMRWGLIPSWSTNPQIGVGLINARSETASEKPAFRDALRSRRCLIPADGFYEWQRTGKSKQPYCFEVSNGELFAFAGLWDSWKDQAGRTIDTCSILTTTPNAVTAPVHERMPVILDPDSYDRWLDPGIKDVSAVLRLLRPYEAKLMRRYPVSTRINHVDNDDVECSAPVKLAQVQASLF